MYRTIKNGTDAENMKALRDTLNRYSMGVAGGHVDDFADKQADTIEAIHHFVNGGDIVVTEYGETVERIGLP